MYLRNPTGADYPTARPCTLHAEPFALPPKEEADSLLHSYFTTVNLMIPCIHEDSFSQVYQRMWKCGPDRMSKPWLGSLNMIFAITTNVMTPTSPPHERATASGTFYERAMELVRPYMFGPLYVEMGMFFPPRP